MSKIYGLFQNDKYPMLVQDGGQELNYDRDFAIKASSLSLHGKPFDANYHPIAVKIASEDVKKKGISDVQVHFSPFLILSKRAVEALSDLLEGAGQMLPVASPVPGLIGFHVTRVINDAVDFNKSVYVMTDNGPLIRKLVLLRDRVQGFPIFKIKENTVRVFVSDEFKRRVEKCKLKGFSFLHEVPLS